MSKYAVYFFIEKKYKVIMKLPAADLRALPKAKIGHSRGGEVKCFMKSSLSLDYPSFEFDYSLIIKADCFEWLGRIPENTFHAIVTDPPYGVVEYREEELAKRALGKGGIWRIPPSFDNHTRAPLPRFTALSQDEKKEMYEYFSDWGRLCLKAILPGAHVIIATNAIMSNLLYSALANAGLEFRGQIIRLVRTLRGGDRPKGAEKEFPHVSTMPRGCYEPWGSFRKPLPPKMKISDCLREFKTGGLRRIADDKPFEDVIPSERTPKREKAIADHPSLKPQSFMRRVVYASLPLNEGIVCDPFMGSGATIAAAEALGINAVGVEKNSEYYEMATKSVPKLRDLRFGEKRRRVLKDESQIGLFG